MIEHHDAQVNGIRLHYASSRAPDKPLMMFLHGFPEFWLAWKNQLEEFGAGHFAVAPDQRGYNLSDKPEPVEQYALPLLAEDAKQLIEACSAGIPACAPAEGRSGPGFAAPAEGRSGPGFAAPAEGRSGRRSAARTDKNVCPTVLVGHDWGGVVAWVVAALHPELLDRLVIINAPHPTIFAREIRDNLKQQMASAYMVLFRSAAAETTLSALNFATLRSRRFSAAPLQKMPLMSPPARPISKPGGVPARLPAA